AMYGSYEIIWPVGPEGPVGDAQERRKGNGIFGPKVGGWKNTRISGVWGVRRLSVATPEGAEQVLLHNPSPLRPLPHGTLPLRERVAVETESGIEMHWRGAP